MPTSAAQLRASKAYHDKMKTDPDWVAARRDKERARRDANREAHNAAKRVWHAKDRMVKEYERLRASDPAAAEAYLTALTA